MDKESSATKVRSNSPRRAARAKNLEEEKGRGRGIKERIEDTRGKEGALPPESYAKGFKIEVKVGMCVRTVLGEEPPDGQPSKSGLTKAKEKYMRLHEEMLERERRQREEEAMLAGQALDGDLVTRTGRTCRTVARKLRERLDAWQDSKIYK